MCRGYGIFHPPCVLLLATYTALPHFYSKCDVFLSSLCYTSLFGPDLHSAVLEPGNTRHGVRSDGKYCNTSCLFLEPRQFTSSTRICTYAQMYCVITFSHALTVPAHACKSRPFSTVDQVPQRWSDSQCRVHGQVDTTWERFLEVLTPSLRS